jgi:hypothetical protein
MSWQRIAEVQTLHDHIECGKLLPAEHAGGTSDEATNRDGA